MSIYSLDGTPVITPYDMDSPIGIAYDINGDVVSLSDWNPVDIHGKLTKSGTHLVDKKGKRFQLRGIGTHALLQYTNLHTLAMFQCLKNWGINCVRISTYLSNRTFKYSNNQMYVGYINAQADTIAEIEKIVGICVQLGMYCIIDWHTMSYDISNGNIMYQNDAVAFWDYFAQKYANVPNVLYELQNEPYGATAEAMGTYVKAEHDKILEYVTDPVMIVGAMSGSINNTINAVEAVGINDVFYSWHPYADDLSVYNIKQDPAYPTIISEWGNANVSGDADAEHGGDNPNVNGFMDDLFNIKLSNSTWKMTDQNHVFSVFKHRGELNSAYYANGFTANDLTAWGTLFFNKTLSYKALAP